MTSSSCLDLLCDGIIVGNVVILSMSIYYIKKEKNIYVIIVCHFNYFKKFLHALKSKIIINLPSSEKSNIYLLLFSSNVLMISCWGCGHLNITYRSNIVTYILYIQI